MSTNILLIGIIILLILSLIFSFIILYYKLFPYLETKNEIRNKEAINKKNELYLNIDSSKISEELNKYIETSVNRYIVYKFIAHKITFINAEETETMVRDLTKSVIIEMSELYLFYIRLLYNISTDNDLVRVVNNLLKNQIIDAVSSYNKAEQIINI